MMKDKLDPAVVRKNTEEYIKTARARAAILVILHEVLTGFEGKAINKRIATALQKKLGAAYSVYWKTEYSWASVEVWNPEVGLDWSNRLSVMIAYDSDRGAAGDGKFNYDYWVAKYGDARTGYAELAHQSELALRTLEQRVAAYNQAFEQLEAANAQLGGLLR